VGSGWRTAINQGASAYAYPCARAAGARLGMHSGLWQGCHSLRFRNGPSLSLSPAHPAAPASCGVVLTVVDGFGQAANASTSLTGALCVWDPGHWDAVSGKGFITLLCRLPCTRPRHAPQ
jgi:hypothetical protein